MKGFALFIFLSLGTNFIDFQRVFGQVSGWNYHKSDSLFQSGLYAEALNENLTALRFLEKSGSCTDISKANLEIGRIHYYLTNRTESSRWFRKTLAIAKRCGLDSMGGICYRNLGALFFEINQFDSADVYLEKARQILSLYKNPMDLSKLYSTLFELHFRVSKNGKDARRFLDSCGYYSERCGDPDQFAFYKVKLGRFYFENGNCKMAIPIFKHLVAFYKKRKFKDGLMNTLENLALTQIKCGEKDSSMANMFYRDRVKDTIFNEKTAQNLAKYEALFETQKKEIENLELKQKNKWLVTFFTFGTFGLLILGFGGYKIQQLRLGRRMAEQKKEEQRQRFLEVIQVQEQERTRIAGDLHDGIGHLMAALKLNTSALDVQGETNSKILENAQTIIDQAAKEVRQISHQLMPQSLSEIGLLASLHELANRINPIGKMQILIQNGGEIPLSRETQVAVYRIVQEVLNNAMKHSGATEFRIGYIIEFQTLHLVLEDNGVGMDLSKEKKSEGIGWKNIRSRAELIGGQMLVFSEKNKGLKIEFQIPLEA